MDSYNNQDETLGRDRLSTNYKKTSVKDVKSLLI